MRKKWMMAIGQQDSGIIFITTTTTTTTTTTKTSLYYILSFNCWHKVQPQMFKIIKYEGYSNETFSYIHLFSMHIPHNYEIYYDYASHDMLIHWN